MVPTVRDFFNSHKGPQLYQQVFPATGMSRKAATASADRGECNFEEEQCQEDCTADFHISKRYVRSLFCKKMNPSAWPGAPRGPGAAIPGAGTRWRHSPTFGAAGTGQCRRRLCGCTYGTVLSFYGYNYEQFDTK